MKKAKLMALFCTLALAATATAGCASKTTDTASTSATDSATTSAGGKDDSSTAAAVSKEDTPDISEKIDLVIGGIDRGNSSDDKEWPESVVQQIEKKLNVNLKLVNYDQQKLGLDLASGELPDVMLVYRINTDSVIKGRHAVPLNKYFDSVGKDLADKRFAFRNSAMAKYQSGGDGNVYFTTPSVSVEGAAQTPPGVGYVVRWDLYKQIGAPEINTPDDYIAAMKKMQALYPKTPAGLPTYALSMYNDVGMHAWTYHGVVDSNNMNLDSDLMFIYNKDTHEVFHNVASDDPHTPFWNDMHFYNKMWKEGLLDPDCFITKGDDLKAKYTKGQYLGGINNWYYGDYNQNVLKDPKSTAGMVLLPCHDTGMGGYSAAGWNDKLIFVSAHSKHIERAVMLLDYINSEEFARLAFSGVKGENWKTGDDGKPALTQETINMKNDPAQAEAWKKLGLNMWDNFCGLGANAIMADGSPASLWITPDMLSQGLSPTEQDMCKTLGVSYPAEYSQNLVKEGKRIDNSSFDNRFVAVMPSPPQDITRIDGNVKEIVMNALPSLVQAKDDAAFAAAREKLMADVKAANVDQALKWWQDSVKQARDDVAAMDSGK